MVNDNDYQNIVNDLDKKNIYNQNGDQHWYFHGITFVTACFAWIVVIIAVYLLNK